MSLPSLTGAEKTKLRGLGQTAPDRVWLGKDGVSPAFVTELNRQLDDHELVKLRFTGGQDRKARAALCERTAEAASCLCLGTVGHTALFWRPRAADAPSSGPRE
ncbi:MAG TPA: YhbY family RNA-binding protein [Lacunisphaera sp.]|nr:YhbY family RNA-binding protein [Lacunisphaera sp.]